MGNKRKNIFILLGTLHLTLSLHANNTSVGLGFLNPSLDLEISHASQNTPIQLKPNSSGSTQYILNMERFNISFSQANAASKEQEAIGLTTEVSDMQFSFFKGFHNFIVSIQSYKGYYVDNANDIDSSFTKSSSESLFPELESNAYVARYLFALNGDKFSLDSVYGIGKQQNNSAGSLILSFALFSESYFASTKGIAPSYADTIFDDLKQFESLKLQGLELQLGYSYTWMITKSFFFNYTALLGRSQVSQDLNIIGQNSETESQTNNSFTAGLSLGINAENYKVNLQAITFTTDKNFGDFQMSTGQTNTGVYFVYRF